MPCQAASRMRLVARYVVGIVMIECLLRVVADATCSPLFVGLLFVQQPTYSLPRLRLLGPAPPYRSRPGKHHAPAPFRHRHPQVVSDDRVHRPDDAQTLLLHPPRLRLFAHDKKLSTRASGYVRTNLPWVTPAFENSFTSAGRINSIWFSANDGQRFVVNRKVAFKIRFSCEVLESSIIAPC